jgi:hypothetical protein
MFTFTELSEISKEHLKISYYYLVQSKKGSEYSLNKAKAEVKSEDLLTNMPVYKQKNQAAADFLQTKHLMVHDNKVCQFVSTHTHFTSPPGLTI